MGGQVQGWPNWWAGGSGGCSAARHPKGFQVSAPELEKLAGTLEGGALRAALAKVRGSFSARCCRRLRVSALLLHPAVLGTSPWPWPPCSGATPAGLGAGAERFCAGAFCSRRGWLSARPPPPPGSPPPSTCKRDPGSRRQQRHRAQRIPAHPELGGSPHTSHRLRAFENGTFKTPG